MHSFRLVPEIRQYDTTKEFCADLHIGMGDLLLISESLYDKFFKLHDKGAIPVFYRKYGSGEPTDLMVEGIYRDLQGLSYQRVIAVGGGTILDVAKLFALKNISPVVDLYDRKLEIQKEKELILVPTTCGTGSEVTNISILELTAKKFVTSKATKEPATALTSAIIQECVQHGLMVEGSGTYNNVIRFLAPLVMTDEQLAAGLDIFENAVAACAVRQ